MWAYLIRRLGQGIVVVFVVSIIVFTLLHFVPGGPAKTILGPRASPQQIAYFNKEYGFDSPLPVQYFAWLNQVVHLNLGVSYRLNEPVAALIATFLPRSVLLVAPSLFIALTIAVPLGILQAVKRNQLPDHIITASAFVFYSMPTFWLGILLITFFAIDIPIFPPEAPQSTSIQGIIVQANGLVLPIMTLTLVSVALFSRYMRSSAVENLVQDYVRTAKAKGVPEFRILYRHVLKNALIPIITLIGLNLPGIFAGALVTESLFNYPGMGYLFWQAALTRDYPVLLGILIIVSLATVFGSLLADVLYALADPRVRYK
jgi:peptide/nickel transport system permease protein